MFKIADYSMHYNYLAGIILFVSIILFLYIFFREEQEIKATSFTISLCIFLGCYLLLSCSSVILAKSWILYGVNNTAGILCQMLTWSGTIGIPASMILATIIVKMVRIYAVFLKPFSYKNKFYSNYALFIYIIL